MLATYHLPLAKALGDMLPGADIYRRWRSAATEDTKQIPGNWPLDSDNSPALTGYTAAWIQPKQSM